MRYSDLGGIEAVLRDITELIEYPLTYPEVRPALSSRMEALRKCASPCALRALLPRAAGRCAADMVQSQVSLVYTVS